MTSVTPTRGRRASLLRRLLPLARRAIFGTLSETYRRCGRAGCHCQTGQKHGPHLYVSFRGSAGTTAGYYVPQALGPRVRTGVAAWQTLQTQLRELTELNRRQLWASRRPRPTTRRARRRAHDPTRVRPA